jgi:Transposase DDE domain
MRLTMQQPLFAWGALDDSPSLQTIQDFLAAIPDGPLLAALRQWRGKGRDDYQVHALWGTLLLTIVLRHPTIEACLADLQRNAALRQLIGIADAAGVPKKWNMSRFLDVLGQPAHLALLQSTFAHLIRPLGALVPDFGRDCAGDSAGLNARAGEKPSGELHAPTGARKEYTDETGQVVKVVAWFGYKFHLLVDVKHEVVLAWVITAANVGDNEVLPQLLAQAQANLPKDRIRTLAYDKACDDEATHRLLHRHRIAPLIQNRALWKEEFDRPLPGKTKADNLVYDEAGTVYCYDLASEPPVRHKMSYLGHEPARGTLKYRCPACHEHWSCPSAARCNAGRKYGRTVRIKRELDLRRFPPIPRATQQFERRYKGRTAVERVNARLKIFWGADDGNIVGPRRFHAFLGTVLVVHAGLATLLASSPRRDGPLGQLRLSAIAQALRARRSA